MKKKLVIGLGLVLFIFFIGAVIVIKNLSTIVLNQNLINEQDIIIGKYNEMLFQIKGAQAELYRHQAGYTKNIDNLVNFIESFDENMIFLSKQYQTHLNDVVCMQCHSKVEERLTSLAAIFSDIEKIMKNYKEEVSIIITTNDMNQVKYLEDAATSEGNIVTELLEKIKHASDKMRGEIKNKRNSLIKRSQIIIFLSISITIALALIIFIAVIRGIITPVNSLISGIDKISSGDFSHRVTVQSKDEIGFMAKAFNNMTEKLNNINEEKDGLLKTLREFNEDLEKKVMEATEKLRITQDNMVRAETLAAIGTLAAGVSHEISTPLNNILGFTQLINSELDENSPLKNDIKVIEQESLRCKKIVQGLLNFAKPPKHEEKLTSINDILNETLTLIEYQPSMRKIIVKKEMDDNLSLLETDPMQLKQVFLNLILNAVQAMPDGGELKIKTGNADKSGIEITVSDTGGGIPVKERQKIFQPFYSTKKDGTGLGLSITYGIVKEHGGEIFVESSVNKGSVFKVFFPYKSNMKSRENKLNSLKRIRGA